jgi:hypothetical protein
MNSPNKSLLEGVFKKSALKTAVDNNDVEGVKRALERGFIHIDATTNVSLH